MKNKIILSIVCSMLMAGCVPTVEVKKYSNVDRFEKNISIIAESKLKSALQVKFASQGWNVAANYKERENKRYELKCASDEKKNKYNAACVLIDNNNGHEVVKVNTILYKNTISQTANIIYERVSEQTPITIEDSVKIY